MTDKTSPTTFADLGLIPTLVERLEELEYSQPTPIQSHTIPYLLEGRDLVGGANTGSGKNCRVFAADSAKNLSTGQT